MVTNYLFLWLINTKYDARVDVILPSVLGKFDNQLKATKEILTYVTKWAVDNRVLKGEIKTVVTDSVKISLTMWEIMEKIIKSWMWALTKNWYYNSLHH